MDSGELRRMLPEKDILMVEGRSVGLIHGSGGPWRMAARIRPLFGDIDVIIFGHSHQPCQHYLQGSLMFNPGTARDSFGILTLDDELKAEIIKI
jgi:predicted phosphodiesterase